LTEKFKFIHDFFHILEDLNINYWLEGGTALAAYRDGEILPWEHDFDIGILKKDIDEKLSLLLGKLSRINCEIIVQKNLPFLDNIIQIYSNDSKSNPNQIDIYLYTLKDDNIYMRWFNSPLGFGSNLIKSIIFLTTKNISKNNDENNFIKKTKIYVLKKIFIFFFLINFYFYKSTYHSFPKKFFTNRKKIFFCGLNLNLPSMIEDFLEYRYGKYWKIPDQKFNKEGKWKSSKARPVLGQNFLPYPKINYNIYKIIKYADKNY